MYEWSPGSCHLVHRVDIAILGACEEALEIVTPQPGSTGVVEQTSFDADGSIEHAPGRFDAKGRFHTGNGSARATLAFDSLDSTAAVSRSAGGAWTRGRRSS